MKHWHIIWPYVLANGTRRDSYAYGAIGQAFMDARAMSADRDAEGPYTVVDCVDEACTPHVQPEWLRKAFR